MAPDRAIVTSLGATVLALSLAGAAGCGGAPSPAEQAAPAPSGQAAPSATDQPERASSGSSATPVEPARWSYEVVRVHPHDPAAFTQGLAYHDGYLYEGTGRRGASSLRRVRIESGEVERRVDLPAALFGEGIAVAAGRVFQLTWTTRLGFVYDLESLERVGQFRQVADGWGLTWDGRNLIQSDGSHRLRFLDPESFAQVREVEVRERGRPVSQINELEYVDGELWANVWHSEELLRIRPAEGVVIGRIDLSGLLDPGAVRDPEAVLNGIAYDSATGRIWVTGKLWPRLFEIRVREAA